MSLTVKALLERESITDAAILRHGFTDYMRDYEIIVGARNGPPNTDIHKYQFIGCAEAVCTTQLGITQLVRTFHEPKSIFGESLADEFVFSGPDYPEKDDPNGFIWGVRFAEVVSGWDYAENGKRAKFWSGRLDARCMKFPCSQMLIDWNWFLQTFVTRFWVMNQP
jgi:hypothetical protein